MKSSKSKQVVLAFLLGVIAMGFVLPAPAYLSDITTDWPAITDDDGSGTTGTVFNLALMNLVKTAINNQVLSATNPTITPAANIDEVVTARGSKATLDTRLDVSINEDGTLNAPSSLLTTSQYQSGVGNHNISINGDFAYWDLGGTVAPNRWSLSVATIIKTGPAQADTFSFGAGEFAAKLTRAGADGYLQQEVMSATEMSANTNARGQKFSVSAKVKTSIASHARILINDGITTTASSYHTGGGTEEHLTATHTISSSATLLQVRLQVNNSAGDAYFGGVVMVFSDLAPSDWSFNADRARVPAQILYKPGLSTTYIGVNGMVSSTTGAAGNTNAGEDDLLTATPLEADLLNKTGRSVRVTAWGTFAANANAKQVKCYFGATALVTSASSTGYNNRSWRAEYLVTRTGAATQESIGWFNVNAAAALADLTVNAIIPTINTANTIAVKCTGEGVATSDIIQRGLLVEVLG